jgi:hypothetical protein
MKKFRTRLLLAIVIFGIANSGHADSSRDDEQWRADKARYDLLDREKFLLSKEEKLSYRIGQLKQNIKALNSELTGSQSELDAVRHELIVLRVKLLP